MLDDYEITSYYRIDGGIRVTFTCTFIELESDRAVIVQLNDHWRCKHIWYTDPDFYKKVDSVLFKDDVK